jgi:hypothetical protein
MGNKVKKMEGKIKYFMKEIKFDMDFIYEFNGNKVNEKDGYDFEYKNKRK